MKKMIFIASVLTAGLFTSQTMRAQGTLYISNLGQTPTGSATVGSDSWIAQEFTTGNDSSGYALNSIQLLMDTASGSPDEVNVSVYSFSFNFNKGQAEPGNDLGSLTGSGPAAGGIFAYTASGLMLSPLTDYFIVLTAATPVTQGAYNWSAVNHSTIDNYWEIYPYYCSSANGSSWTGHSRQDVFQMAIYATAIPKPSAAAVLLLGSGLCFFARRTSKKSSLLTQELL